MPMRFKRHLSTVDAHTGGEPFRIITGGLPPLPGATILDRRRYMREHMDGVRRVLMYEPRGHHGMYGAVLTPPVTPEADLGILFMHNEGYSTMCGHGIIAAATVLLETGMLVKEGPEPAVTFDTPAGTVHARARFDGDRVQSVRFENVPSFVLAADVRVPLKGGGELTADIAFGGAFYAYVDAPSAGVRVQTGDIPRMQALQVEIKQHIEAHFDVRHPLEPELAGIYGVIFTDAPQRPDAHGRNVCVFADQQIDRSPCGTGTAARVALLHARGLLAQGQSYGHESIVGSLFHGRVIRPTAAGPFPAVVAEVEGDAHITGFHQFVVDPSDPQGDGFLLR